MCLGLSGRPDCLECEILYFYFDPVLILLLQLDIFFLEAVFWPEKSGAFKRVACSGFLLPGQQHHRTRSGSSLDSLTPLSPSWSDRLTRDTDRCASN